MANGPVKSVDEFDALGTLWIGQMETVLKGSECWGGDVAGITIPTTRYLTTLFCSYTTTSPSLIPDPTQDPTPESCPTSSSSPSPLLKPCNSICEKLSLTINKLSMDVSAKIVNDHGNNGNGTKCNGVKDGLMVLNAWGKVVCPGFFGDQGVASGSGGFGPASLKSDVTKYCQSTNTTDPCCQSIYLLSQSSSTTTTTSSPTTSTARTLDSMTSSSNIHQLSALMITLIVVLISMFIFSVVALCVVFGRRKYDLSKGWFANKGSASGCGDGKRVSGGHERGFFKIEEGAIGAIGASRQSGDRVSRDRRSSRYFSGASSSNIFDDFEEDFERDYGTGRVSSVVGSFTAPWNNLGFGSHGAEKVRKGSGAGNKKGFRQGGFWKDWKGGNGNGNSKGYNSGGGRENTAVMMMTEMLDTQNTNGGGNDSGNTDQAAISGPMGLHVETLSRSISNRGHEHIQEGVMKRTETLKRIEREGTLKRLMRQAEEMAASAVLEEGEEDEDEVSEETGGESLVKVPAEATVGVAGGKETQRFSWGFMQALTARGDYSGGGDGNSKTRVHELKNVVRNGDTKTVDVISGSLFSLNRNGSRYSNTDIESPAAAVGNVLTPSTYTAGTTNGSSTGSPLTLSRLSLSKAGLPRYENGVGYAYGVNHHGYGYGSVGIAGLNSNGNGMIAIPPRRA
ncbi:hypothetical protein HDU76_010584 [Blyttiomyces sp. JEL0837]|nr:hypothetical protein HDU76_010584 [Blyttiomyces sp. JEL0837]